MHGAAFGDAFQKLYEQGSWPQSHQPHNQLPYSNELFSEHNIQSSPGAMHPSPITVYLKQQTELKIY